jgi:hypothetical protein
MNKTFLILITLFSITTSLSQDISGTWNGRLGIDQERLNIRFNIQKTTDGYTSTCCNNCLVSSKKVNSISYENSILKIKFDGLEFQGTYRSDNVIVGELKRAEESFPMELSFSYSELYENGEPKKWFEEQPISVSEGSSKFGNSQKMISVQQKTYTSKSKTYSGNNLINYIVSEKMSGVYNTFYGNENFNTTDTIGKYVNGKREGEWKKKYPGSNLVQNALIYQDGKLVSEVQFIYLKEKNLKHKESFFKDGKIIKYIIYYYTDTTSDKFSKDEVIFNGNLKINNTYSYNGNLSFTYSSSSITNKKEGFEIDYFDNGNIKYKTLYKDDKQISYEEYFENGIKKIFIDSKITEKYNENGGKIFYLDKINKKGFVIYESGEKWEGDFNKGEKTIGKGTYYYNGGDKYVGAFNSDENIADGTGEYYWQNGSKYIGNFKDGKINGYGKLIYPNGSIAEGLWQNEELVNDYHKKQITSSETSGKSVNNSINENSISPLLLIALKAADDYIKNPEPFKASSTSNSNTSKSTASNNNVRGSKPCSYCNKTIKKPYLLDRCKTDWRNETKPGYVKCGSCEGYGFRTTHVGCDCPDGIGYCFKENCSVSSCENGWIGCSSCNRTGQSR